MFYKIYTNLPSEIITFGESLIKDAECKHIAISTPEQIASVFELKAAFVNYDYCYMSLKNNYNVKDNQKYVYRMADVPNFRPAKYIIDKTTRIWADNTHTSLSIMVRNGIAASINSSDFYFVDLREGNNIFQPSYLPILSDTAYFKIINNSLKLQKRIDEGWRPLSLSYTMERLYLDDHYGVE